MKMVHSINIKIGDESRALSIADAGTLYAELKELFEREKKIDYTPYPRPDPFPQQYKNDERYSGQIPFCPSEKK